MPTSDVVRGPGQPLDAATRTSMEGSFGHSFANVRIHSDAEAAASAQAHGAHAYTTGRHVVFARDRYAPTTAAGRWLLAHELTHVVQQGGSIGSDGRVMRKAEADAPGAPAAAEDPEKEVPEGPATEESEGGEPDSEGLEGLEETGALAQAKAELAPGGSDSFEREADHVADRVSRGEHVGGTVAAGGAAPRIQLYSARICRRDSTQFADFPATHISHIDVDLASPQHSVTLTWTGPSAAQGRTGPFQSSPGAGNCGLDCNDEETSRRGGSHCTPKVTNTPIHRQACALGGHPEATNASYFSRSGIAFHRYPSVPTHPASHGCVRLHEATARLIYDNVRSGVTTVTVGGTWARGTRNGRPVCWGRR